MALSACHTCVHAVVGLQLVLEAELLSTAITFIGLLPSVDPLVALQRALVSEAAPAELALVWMVTRCKKKNTKKTKFSRFTINAHS